MQIDLNEVVEQCVQTINQKIKDLKTLNIIVAGKTGVGKSTLINAVFRENLVATGIGNPVTMHMRKISKKDVPLRIFDTRGFELGKDAQNEVKREIIETINKGTLSENANDYIHCIWYCINTASNRVEEEEIHWLQSLAAEQKTVKVPIIIILTQSFSRKKSNEMKNYLLAKNLDVVQVIPVLAEDYEIDEEYPTIKAFGLDQLIEVMAEALPEELQDTLQNVQRVSLRGKMKRAHAVVAAMATAAFGEGYVPIPFSDAALLVPTQVGMVAAITAIFGIELSKSTIMAFVTSTLGAGGLTIAGKTLAANLLKLVPGAGSVVGGAISGSTAGLLTTAFGEAYIQLMVAVYKGELKATDIGTSKGQEKMRKLIKKEIKHS